MFFRKRGKLKRDYNEKLIHSMDETKQEWMKQKHLEELSMDQDFYIHYQTKIAEAKYFFLLREAKVRKIVIKR